jgi:hypothetical protein
VSQSNRESNHGINLQVLRPGPDGLVRYQKWIVPTVETRAAYERWWKQQEAKSWPKLSQTLEGPRDPTHCQSCGAAGAIHDADESILKLTRWREFDERDHPTSTLVLLCEKCGKKLIKKHPRRYEHIAAFAPAPGAMPVCALCSFCSNLACRHPDLKENGGEGLQLNVPQPTKAHIKAGRDSGWINVWRGPVTCEGREERFDANQEKELVNQSV